nr:unnamed protein product [Callosobruchus chinensis]
MSSELDKAFPEAFKLADLLLTIPATSASVERSFSAMKRIKTCQRNTQLQDRMSSLSLISIEKNFLNGLMKRPSFYDSVIEIFANKIRTRKSWQALLNNLFYDLESDYDLYSPDNSIYGAKSFILPKKRYQSEQINQGKEKGRKRIGQETLQNQEDDVAKHISIRSSDEETKEPCLATCRRQCREHFSCEDITS